MSARAWNWMSIAFGILTIAATGGMIAYACTTFGAVCGLTASACFMGTFTCGVAAIYAEYIRR